MLARAIPTLVVVPALCVSAISSCRPSAEELPRRPNVLLVSVETIRADHVGASGYHRNTTPNFDRLARQGALFRNAVAQAPFTLPSVASLMTGRTPPFHGVRNHPATLRADLETLAERFRAAGYQTAAMTRHTWLRRKSGLDQGFDEYHNNKFSAGLDARSLSLAAVDWMRARDEEKPFFLWLHFLDPHLPYTPSYPYSVLYHPDHTDDSQVRHVRSMLDRPRETFQSTPYADLSGGPFYDLVLRYYPENRILLDLSLWRRPRGSIFFNEGNYDERSLTEMRDLYDGAIVYADDNLGRILKSLAELGIEEDTAVAIVGDHGEALGEHGLYFTHDFTLYDEVLRVPMALRLPGVIEPGTVVDRQVRVMDLGTTLLDLAGLPAPEEESVSLAPLFDGEGLPFLDAFAEGAPLRPMFPEHRRVYFEGNRGKWRMLRTERWKLIQIPHPEGDRFELYDLENDPGELENLFDQLPGEAGKLEPRLRAWIQSDPERDTNRSAEEEKALDALTPEERQQLETLGYFQSTDDDGEDAKEKSEHEK